MKKKKKELAQIKFGNQKTENIIKIIIENNSFQNITLNCEFLWKT